MGLRLLLSPWLNRRQPRSPLLAPPWQLSPALVMWMADGGVTLMARAGRPWATVPLPDGSGLRNARGRPPGRVLLAPCLLLRQASRRQHLGMWLGEGRLFNTVRPTSRPFSAIPTPSSVTRTRTRTTQPRTAGP